MIANKNPNENFHIIISELANIDLKTFLKENYPKDKNEIKEFKQSTNLSM